jgi:hypothetical protein
MRTNGASVSEFIERVYRSQIDAEKSVTHVELGVAERYKSAEIESAPRMPVARSFFFFHDAE